MKIGYFTAHFPYESQPSGLFDNAYTYGGSSFASYELARGMAKIGNQVLVFTSSADFKDSKAESTNMTLYRYGTFLRVLTAHMPPKIFYDPITHDVDLVHTHMSIFPAADAGFFYSKVKGTPLVLTYHSDNRLDYGPFFRRSFLTLYDRLPVDEILSHAKAIIVPSLRVLETSKRLQPYVQKIKQIPNGVNVDFFDVPKPKEYCRKSIGISKTEFVILFVGALVHPKGPQILIQALRKVIDVIPDTRLILVGEGYGRNELEKLAVDLDLQKHVYFAGLIRKELPMYLKSSDVSVVPSFQENFPLVVLEAMAAGIPVIASSVGGVQDLIIDGKTGLSVQPGDPDALTDAILRVYRDEYLRNQMSNRARKLAQKYSWESVAEETEKLYRHVLYD